MSLTTMQSSVKHPEWDRVPEDSDFGDSSPFGLQGLSREILRILKPEFINRLAATLALKATSAQLHDPSYIQKVLSWHPDWMDEYQVVHLIEQSLWIHGHSDLVMTMTKNPSQIPDNPPEKIKQALTRAYTWHSDATVWYGVPLFGERKTEDGLPIPVTAQEVRAEAIRRIEAARQHAISWGWLYRAAVQAARIPSLCWRVALTVRNRIRKIEQGMEVYWKTCRQDARRRARAIILAEGERCRYGDSKIVIPPHRTLLGRSLETAGVLFELAIYEATVSPSASPLLAAITGPLAVVKYLPLMIVPVAMVSCDPFLFVELPDEPGKLRHLGHWYWQQQEDGQQKLHLHV